MFPILLIGDYIQNYDGLEAMFKVNDQNNYPRKIIYTHGQ